jgi:hypothetical protein
MEEGEETIHEALGFRVFGASREQQETELGFQDTWVVE